MLLARHSHAWSIVKTPSSHPVLLSNGMKQQCRILRRWVQCFWASPS